MPSGSSATSILPAIEAVLAGRSAPLLPCPADETRQTSLLTTSLRAGEPIDDDIAVVVPTSGTTGIPKGAMLSAAALTASARATHDRLGGTGKWLLALPAHHIAGLQVLVRSVLAGTTPAGLDISGGFDTRALPTAVASMGSGRRYASLVAAQLAKALTEPAATAALAALDAVLIGGGPTPGRILEDAAAAGISVIRSYGMSETAGGCVYDGLPLAGVTMRIDGDAEGPVMLGGTTLARGYRNPPDSDPFAEPGWFRTDDIGTLDISGRLHILGRIDEAISTGGLTVLPQPVETVLVTHPAIADCAVFGVADDRLGQRVVAAAVLRPGAAPPSVRELRALVETVLDRTAAPREVHIVDELPRRGIGKVDRAVLIGRFG